MKLRNQILGIGLAGAAAAAVVGGVGMLGVARLSEAFQGTVQMGSAVQSSQAAAMMHGAVRGDVQRAMLGSIGRDKAQIAGAKKELETHSEQMTRALAVLQSAPLSPAAHASIESTVPLARTYLESAKKIITLAEDNFAPAAAVAIPEFQKQYLVLEKHMEQQVAAINTDSHAFSETSEAAVRQAGASVGVALLAITALLIAIALWLAQRMTRPMVSAVKVAKQLARGDLSGSIELLGNAETIELLGALSDMQTSLRSIVQSVKDHADAVASASAEIASGNHDLSARTETQATVLQETTASMSELSATVSASAQSAGEANTLAQQASRVAADGGGVVNQVVQTMQEINDSSKKISEIISVIDGIAFQTNILALNAAVEAARAGEQGRGFAVVASEVRSLAGRSAEAAKEISALISASVARAEKGGQLVNHAGSTMVDVVSSIGRVTDIVGTISAASASQSQGFMHLEQSVRSMDETTQQNAALVEQMAAAASSLKQQAQELVGSVAIFKLRAD
jgi:methyl-accepting chemotaxis protein